MVTYSWLFTLNANSVQLGLFRIAKQGALRRLPPPRFNHLFLRLRFVNNIQVLIYEWDRLLRLNVSIIIDTHLLVKVIPLHRSRPNELNVFALCSDVYIKKIKINC